MLMHDVCLRKAAGLQVHRITGAQPWFPVTELDGCVRFHFRIKLTLSQQFNMEQLEQREIKL